MKRTRPGRLDRINREPPLEEKTWIPYLDAPAGCFHRKLSIVLFFLGVFILLDASPSHGAIHNLGTFGQTYQIAEQDALQEIKERVARLDPKKLLNRKMMKKALQNYQPDMPFLPRAHKDATRLVDMTYTLPFDIPDGKGGILYPKGYTFNPLEYVNYEKTLVVINGDDPGQVLWFSGSDYSKNIRTMLLLTGGSYYELGKKLDRPVFYANADIIHRFQLEAVPSIVRQRGKYMEVKEVAISDKTAQ